MDIKKSEWQGMLALLAIILFLGLIFLNYSTTNKASLFEKYNATCTLLSESLQFNESTNITCNCYYENVNTGVSELDNATLPFCTCDCLRDGLLSKIAIRAV